MSFELKDIWAVEVMNIGEQSQIYECDQDDISNMLLEIFYDFLDKISEDWTFIIKVKDKIYGGTMNYPLDHHKFLELLESYGLIKKIDEKIENKSIDNNSLDNNSNTTEPEFIIEEFEPDEQFLVEKYTLIFPSHHGNKSHNNSKWYRLINSSEEFGFFTLYSYSSSVVVLYNFGIYEKYRGKGYGKIMLKECLNMNKNKKIVLFVSEENKTAYKLYNSAGFKPSRDFKPPKDEICMVLINSV